jgi:single-stranded-DNA-specific exonuclease
MTPIETFTRLRPVAQEIITNYIRSRGITAAGFTEYLQPTLQLELGHLPEAEQFIQRLTTATNKKETILIFGDYDCDGITSTSILLRCLRELAGISPAWSLPNRQHDFYGLDLEKAKSLFKTHQPSLLVCLDCGTNSNESIAWLKQQGVDTLVADHHPLEGNRPEAIAVVNPKAHGTDTDDCCAAGLTLLLCERLAKAWDAEPKWNRDTALILAGVGTVADAVSLTPLNRAIVKNAIRLLNDRRKVAAIPGLAALLVNAVAVNQRQLQFNAIPKVNAIGRLGDAEPAVTMLTTTDPIIAKNIATHCCERNEQRKQLQRQMVHQAKALAGVIVSDHPETPVLVLAEAGWHHGVAGPAASQVAETFQRSTILLAPNGELWKGSGRSANGDHLGRWVQDVKNLGLAERGGGHAAAVGLVTTSAQIAMLQSAGLFLPMPQTDHEPETEIIGDIGQLNPADWAAVSELLAPFGRKNPFPIISAKGAVCQDEPTALVSKEDQKIWAMKTKFKTGGGKTFTAIWRDADAARQQWTTGARCDLTLELTVQRKSDKIFYNWSAISSQPSVINRENQRQNPEPLAATGRSSFILPRQANA